MKFKNKNDIIAWLNNYKIYFSYDPHGYKYYFVFEDIKRNGQYTIMRYNTGSFTIHGQGINYCDPEEHQISFDQLISFIWTHRKQIHKEIKELIPIN